MSFAQKKYSLFLLLISIHMAGFCQQELNVALNHSFFKAKDTIKITATQKQDKKNIATLFLMAEHEEGMIWEMRWPMLNGRCEAAVIIPDSMPAGQYRFRFSVLQNLFTVFGKVKTPEDVTALNSTLLTSAGDLYETETTVNEEGIFTYKNVLFENDATLLFTLQETRNNDNLNIEISTVLDSVVYPRKDKILDIYIGQTEPENGVKKFISKIDNTDSLVQVLEAVTVYSKPTNRGEIFNKKYSTGLFRDMNERIINLLDEPALNNSFSALQLVSMRYPAITLSGGMFPTARWRGDRVYFYVDEMRADASLISSIPVSEVAIIKVYPPPFFGNMGGSGGAIAVYTKRGGLTDDNYKNAFKVKGYTPLLSEFPADPDKL